MSLVTPLRPEDIVPIGKQSFEYEVFLNESANRFESYIEGDNMLSVYSGIAPVEEESALEWIFYIFNNEHPEDYHSRSISIADVVRIEENYYACQPVGWLKLDHKPNGEKK